MFSQFGAIGKEQRREQRREARDSGEPVDSALR
jgi:hypothetical protein